MRAFCFLGSSLCARLGWFGPGLGTNRRFVPNRICSGRALFGALSRRQDPFVAVGVDEDDRPPFTGVASDDRSEFGKVGSQKSGAVWIGASAFDRQLGRQPEALRGQVGRGGPLIL